MADTADYPEDVFDRAIAINLKGAWLCMIPQMLKMGGRDRQYGIGCGTRRGCSAFRVRCLKAWGSRLD